MTDAVSPATDWQAVLAPYKGPSTWRSVFQLVNTAVPFVLLWCAMLWSLQIGYWLTLLLAVPTAMLLTRLFMFQHDCGHGAFFKSRRAANLVGGTIGVMTLMPYVYWRKTHAVHHATSGNLDDRELRRHRYADGARVPRPADERSGSLYRLYRNPLVMLLDRAGVPVPHQAPTPARSPAQLAAGMGKRPPHQPGTAHRDHGHVPHGGAPELPAAATADHADGGIAGRVPLLRAAPVRGHLLALSARTGTTGKPGWGAARIWYFRRYCSGSPATSGFTTYITCRVRFRTTGSSAVSTRTLRSRTRHGSRSVTA